MLYRVVVLTFALALSAAAQRGGISNVPNSRSNQSLTVRISTDNDQPLNFPVRVQLTNNAGTTIAEKFAHSGMIDFDGLREGNYRLRITGSEIEDTVTDTFSISGIQGTPLQFVHVKMRARAGTSAAAPAGSVSSYDLNVPDKAREELRKGDEEIARQQWKKAIQHFEKAIAIAPRYASAWNDLGVACMKSGDKARARQSFQKAVELDERSGRAYLNLARFSLMERNYPETIRLASKSLALAPDDPEALVMLSDSEIATGQYDLALAHARKVHQLQHDHFAVAHVIAAAALEAQQKPAEAAAEYQTFLREDPKSPRAPAARKALSRLSAQASPAATGPNPKP